MKRGELKLKDRGLLNISFTNRLKSFPTISASFATFSFSSSRRFFNSAFSFLSLSLLLNMIEAKNHKIIRTSRRIVSARKGSELKKAINSFIVILLKKLTILRIDPNKPRIPIIFDMASSFMTGCLFNFTIKGGSLSKINYTRGDNG